MPDKLLLHNKTEWHALRMIKSPAQALLIYGPAGSGKRALAEFIAAQLLGIEPLGLADYPYFYLIDKAEGKQEISIESVREAIKQLQLKAVIGSQKPVNRVVLIEGAHTASTEAQNALLKAIEEPPAGTVFILTAESDTAVLPTIASRSEKLPVVPVGLNDALSHYKKLYAGNAVESAWQLSGGTAGLLDALLKDSDTHPLKQSVEAAKKILGAKRYERLLMLDELSGNKAALSDVLAALGRIFASLHHLAINAGNEEQAKRLIAARKMADSASRGLENNASPKLTALDIALRLPV